MKHTIMRHVIYNPHTEIFLRLKVSSSHQDIFKAAFLADSGEPLGYSDAVPVNHTIR